MSESANMGFESLLDETFVEGLSAFLTLLEKTLLRDNNEELMSNLEDYMLGLVEDRKPYVVTKESMMYFAIRAALSYQGRTRKAINANDAKNSAICGIGLGMAIGQIREALKEEFGEEGPSAHKRRIAGGQKKSELYKAEAPKWKRKYDEYLKANPRNSKKQAYKYVAEFFRGEPFKRLSAKTVETHIKNLLKKKRM